jgi:RNA polymerase sigma-70 factor (ECF subfamily)
MPIAARNDSANSHARFDTTHWSLVLAAGQKARPESRDAIATLCEVYWYPIYAFLRRRGRNAEEAGDLTQSFFARLLDKELLGRADPARGRFRSYLLKSLQNFVSNEDEQARALKRGGGDLPIALDVENAEGRYRLEPSHEITPECLFERRWALALLDRILVRLRQQSVHGKDGREFDRLKVFLGGALPDDSYAAAGGELGMTEANVKVMVHRMRASYRQLLREEIGRTVESPAQIDDELKHLFQAVGR